MHRVTLLAVGRLKSPWTKDGCAEYIKRLRPQINLEIVELPASTKEEESEQMIHRLEKLEGRIFLLDERGIPVTSEKFAQFVIQSRDSGSPLVFILGGAYGVNDDVRRIAAGSIRLSDMTLPHELCRVIFLEQLYRAVEIGKGSGYHH